jgi:hypothetical protein
MVLVIPFILNLIHLIIVFLPIIILFIDVKYTKNIIHWILLLAVLLPLHWVFFKNKCALTLLSKKFGGYKEYSDNEFTRENLEWLYRPVLRVFDMEWNKENITTISIVHSMVNILILWGYTFFLVYNKKCLC